MVEVSKARDNPLSKSSQSLLYRHQKIDYSSSFKAAPLDVEGDSLFNSLFEMMNDNLKQEQEPIGKCNSR